MKNKMGNSCNDTREEDLDDTLCSLLTDETGIEKRIDEFREALTTACNKSFHIQRVSRSAPLHRTVPWWSAGLRMLTKRTNALHRLYQRTRNNEELRERRKTQYFECKATYAASIRREKIRSWKEYCTMTSASNPWSAAYKLAAGKRNTSTPITTLRKPDGTLTADTTETLRLMTDTFTPEDNVSDDNDYH